jgi:hypothetical protein
MKIGMTLVGGNALGAALSRLDKTKSLEATLGAAAEDIRQAAAANLSNIRDDTGELAESLTVEPVQTVPDSLSFSVSTPLDYGWHLESGTLNRPAQPWLAPALDAATPTIQRRLREWLDTAVKDAARR